MTLNDLIKDLQDLKDKIAQEMIGDSSHNENDIEHAKEVVGGRDLYMYFGGGVTRAVVDAKEITVAGNGWKEKGVTIEVTMW